MEGELQTSSGWIDSYLLEKEEEPESTIRNISTTESFGPCSRVSSPFFCQTPTFHGLTTRYFIDTYRYWKV